MVHVTASAIPSFPSSGEMRSQVDTPFEIDDDHHLKAFYRFVPGARNLTRFNNIQCVNIHTMGSALDNFCRLFRPVIAEKLPVDVRDVDTYKEIVRRRITDWFPMESICIDANFFFFGVMSEFKLESEHMDFFLTGFSLSQGLKMEEIDSIRNVMNVVSQLETHDDTSAEVLNQEKVETSSLSLLSEVALKRRNQEELLFGRKLGTITRTVSNEADLKQAVKDANDNTGDEYHVTVAGDIQFSGVFPGWSSVALVIYGGKMNIVGGVVGRKTQLRGQGQSGDYRIFAIDNGAVVHLEQLEITNGYVNFFLFIFFFLS